ncbi:MAG: PASTA domain-containing protein, partial [Oscillospiraceae bacterium]|nr:PASTA domain-containing protein [Oscillospiraceae bacterium]
YNNYNNKINMFKEENNNQKQKKSLTAIQSLTGIALALVVASIIFVVVAYLVYNPFAPSKEVEVPDLVGKVYQEVLKEDKYKSFDIQQETTSYSEEYDEGYIFEQTPNPGRVVKNKAIIKVKVSKGRKFVTIPDFSNKRSDTATSELQKLGLKVSVAKMHDPEITENFVIKTNPDKDSEVPMGTTVRVYVSTGAEQKLVSVPSLIGVKLEDAVKLLKEQDLNIGEISSVDTDIPEGIIVAQDPDKDSQVPVNTFININKSSGNKPIKSLVLPIRLPYITEVVNAQALLDGKEVKAERIEPAGIESGVWRVEIEGEGTGKVKIMFDNKPYAEFSVDFDNSKYEVTKNYSANFPQRPENQED